MTTDNQIDGVGETDPIIPVAKQPLAPPAGSLNQLTQAPVGDATPEAVDNVMPDAPAGFTPDMVASAVTDQSRDDAMVLRSTLMNATQHNPDKVAEALPVSERAGLPLMPTMRNMAEVQKQEQFTPDYVAGLLQSHPDVSTWLADPSNTNLNAAIAHDDVPVLSRIEDAIKGYPDWAAGKAETLIPDTEMGMAHLYDTANKGAIDLEIAHLSYNKMMGDNTPEDDQRETWLRGLSAQAGDGTLPEDGMGLFGKSATTVFSMAPMLGEIASQTMKGTMVGTAVGLATGNPEFSLIGEESERANAEYTIFAGQAYDSLSQIKDDQGNPLDPSVIKPVAMAIGALNAGMTHIGLGKIAETIPGLNSVVAKGQLMALLKSPQTGAQLLQIAKSYGVAIGAGGAMMGAQTGISDIGQNIAQDLSTGDFKNKSLGDILNDVVESAKTGAGVGALIGLPGSALHVADVLDRAGSQPSPAAVAGYVKNIQAAVDSSKLAQRSPDAMRSFLNSALHDEDYYVNAQKVQTFYQKLSDEERDVLNGNMPEFADDLSQALTENTDMKINRADYHGYLGPLGPKGYLEESLRMMPEHMSQQDIQDAQEMHDSLYPTPDDTNPEATAARENFVNQLIQQYGQKRAFSGNADIANQLGEFHGAAYNAFSARYGHIEGAQDLIDQSFKNLIVQRNVPFLDEVTTKADNLDLQIDRARNIVKAEQAKQDAAANRPADLLGDKKKTKAEPKTPMPIIDYLIKSGKIKTGSSAAKDLAPLEIKNKKLFSKYGTIESLDNLPHDEVQSALGDLMTVKGQKTSVRDNTPSYVDKDWLTESLRDETLGNGQLSEDQQMKESERQHYAQLTDAIDQSGADLMNDPTPVIKQKLQALRDQMKADSEGGKTFNQTKGGEAQGSMTFFKDGRTMMSLFEKEDASTVLHELGHLYWNVMEKIGGLEGATDEVRNDIETMRQWVGAEAGAELTEAQHEKIADGFLKYIKTGEAPSAELQVPFQRFKGWLVRLYRGIRDSLLPTINKDVAGVFDRMLATDEQIEAIRNNPEFKLDDHIMGMLGKSDQVRAQRKVNRMLEKAKEALLTKAMRQMERANSADYKEKRAVVKDEMTKRINASEPFRIIDAIKGAGGMSRKDLVALKGGKEILTYMPGGKDKVVMGKGGADPRDIARLMNMDPNAMIDKIMDIPSRSEQIERATDAEMIVRHGDMMNDGTLEREAVLKAHNDYHAQVLAMELKMLSDKAKIIAPSKEAIKYKAFQFLGEKSVRDIQPYRHQRAEVTAARAVGKALGKGDFTKAAQAKAQELLNHYMFKGATEAKADMEKAIAKFRRITNGKDSDLTNVRQVTDSVTGEKKRVRFDIDYIYAARAILAKYGLGKNTYDFTKWYSNLQGENPDLADSLSQAMAMWSDPPAATQRQIRNGKYAGRTVTTPPWQYMTLNDFRGLSDAIDNLMQVAEQQNVMTLNRGTDKAVRVDIADALEQVSDQLSGQGASSVSSGYAAELTKMDQTKWNLLSVKASYRRVEQLVKSIDRGENGPWRTYIWNPIKDALNIYRDQERLYMAKVKDILEPHRDRLYGDKIEAPELSSKESPEGYTFTNLGQVVGMLLHTGNESNRFKLIEGYGWDEDRFNGFIDRIMHDGTIGKEDMELVQNLWNLADELKPEAQRAMKEMHGYRFDEITASPVETPWGQYKGGYWPAVVDRNVSEDAQIRQDNEAISTGGQTFMYPSTGRGFTKSRVEAYAGPLEMSLNLLPSHIDKVLRFIHVEPAIKDVAKIVMNRSFRDTAQKVDRTLTTEMLVPWMQRAARQVTEMPIKSKAWSFVNRAAGWLKRQSGAAVFIGNIPNTFIHTGQIFPLIRIAGAGNVGEAMMKLLKDRDATQTMIRELSPEIRNRGLPGDVSAEAQVKRLMTDRNKYTKFNDWTMDHAYILQHLVWSEIDHIGWLASFNKAMEGGIDGVDAGDQLASARHGDAVVRELQGSHNPEDISNIEARSHIAKLFQFWYGFFNNSGNVLMTESANIARGSSSTGARAAGLCYLALMNVVAVSMWAEITSGTARGATPAPQDYKDTPAWLEAMGEYLGGGLLRYSTGLVHPGLATLTEFALNQISGNAGYADHIVASPVLDTFEKTIKEFPALYNAMFKHGSWETAFRDVTGGALGIAFPIVGVAKRPGAYAIGLAEHKIHPENALDVGRGIIGGPRPGNMKQR